MKNNLEKESKEKKSLKEVVMENKNYIFAGVACASTCVLGYLLFKEVKVNKILNDDNIKLLRKNCVVHDLKDQVETVQEAMSEGMIQEAIATTARKLNARIDKRDRLLSKINLDEREKEKLQKTIEEITVFKKRMNAFEKLRVKYYIED